VRTIKKTFFSWSKEGAKKRKRDRIRGPAKNGHSLLKGFTGFSRKKMARERKKGSLRARPGGQPLVGMEKHSNPKRMGGMTEITIQEGKRKKMGKNKNHQGEKKGGEGGNHKGKIHTGGESLNVTHEEGLARQGNTRVRFLGMQAVSNRRAQPTGGP